MLEVRVESPLGVTEGAVMGKVDKGASGFKTVCILILHVHMYKNASNCMLEIGALYCMYTTPQ